MHRLTDNIEQLLRKLAGMLPQVTVHSHEKHYVKGSEILEWGTVTEIDGKPVIPEKMYLWRYPVISQANHYRRLKTKFSTNGIEGVKVYLEWINGLAKGHKMSKQMEALMTVIKTIAEN